MKEARYMGQDFEVPDWANFIVANKFGEVFATVSMPQFVNSHLWFSCVNYELVGNLYGEENPIESI